jgi:hypothetical protein
MGKIILTLIRTIGLLLPLMAQAQGTLEVSNLDQASIGSMGIGSDSWIAQTFVTGTNSEGYVLNSVQLLMDDSSLSPVGFSVSIYSKTGDPHSMTLPGDSPESSLGSLSGPDPAAGGVFTYNASDITLSPSTVYFVVVTAATPIAQGAYAWSAANAYTDTDDHWIIDDSYFGSANGSSWTFVGRQDVFQLGIYATAVPEPATLALLFLGGGALVLFRFGNMKQREIG